MGIKKNIFDNYALVFLCALSISGCSTVFAVDPLNELIGMTVPPFKNRLHESAGSCVGSEQNICSVAIAVLEDANDKPIAIYAGRQITQNVSENEIGDESRWLITDILPYPKLRDKQYLDMGYLCAKITSPVRPIVVVIGVINSKVNIYDWIYSLDIDEGKFRRLDISDIECTVSYTGDE